MTSLGSWGPPPRSQVSLKNQRPQWSTLVSRLTFQQQLIRAIADAERDDPKSPSHGYYESWLVAMESLLQEKALLTDPKQ